MPEANANPLIVAISSRTLFDLEDSHVLFERDGLDAYAAVQRSHEDDVLAPGIAFPLVRKLLGLNDGAPLDAPRVEVILISRNSADTGLRIFNSIEQHGLAIQRAAFSNGAPPFPYIRPFGADLFLSAHGDDVRNALAAGVAAATLLPARAAQHRHTQLRIAFDGDAVIFDDEGERVSTGAEIERLGQVIRTLRDWGIRLDEALFLGGRAKGPFLEAFGADIFFDDSEHNILSARDHVAAGHVPHGVANRG